jgi:hypothetical protein
MEFTVIDVSLPPILLPVSSFVAQLTGADPEIPMIACIDPVETAIDKLSALVWRVPDRVREPRDDDPDLVRHIHDLVTLHQRATTHKNFKRMAIEMIGRDDSRCAKISGWPLKEKVAFLMETLETDREYHYASKNLSSLLKISTTPFSIPLLTIVSLTSMLGHMS